MSRLNTNRLDGLDLARCLALFGMVLVNFRLAMGIEIDSSSLWSLLPSMLEGRSAALFVILSGVGLGLATKRLDWTTSLLKTWWRSGLLLLIGMGNLSVFPADIIHYYALYFFLAAPCLKLSSKALLAILPIPAVVSITLMQRFDFSQGWDWVSLTYTDFWHWNGFMRNLWFNGWHPAFPWVTFVIFGLWLSRLRLSDRVVQRRMMLWGGMAVALARLPSLLCSEEAPFYWLLSTSPVPPTPLYLISAGGSSAAVIGACLYFCCRYPQAKVIAWLLPAGQQTLTLYIAHIALGMGILEAVGALQGKSLSYAMLAVLTFCLAAVLFARVWADRFQRGPLEIVMQRWMAGLNLLIGDKALRSRG